MLRRIVVAVTSVLLALLFKLLLVPFLNDTYGSFLIFFTAVVISAWYGGLAPGLLATLMATLLADYFFVPPTGAFFSGDMAANARLLIFALEGLLASVLSHLTRYAFEQAGQELEERRKAERALAESEERFRLLVERVQEYAIFMINPDSTISTWNAGAERIKGFRADEIIGKPYTTFFLPDDVAAGKPKRLLEMALAQGAVEDEGWRVRKDGTLFWADALLTALYDAKGKLRGYSKVTRDLTERHRSDQQLKEALERERMARAEAEKADALKLQFLGMVSHELRTPLTAIKGFTSTLLAEDVGWEPDVQREFIRIMDEEADKLTALIEQLLNVSRLKAGTFSILPVPGSLKEAVDAVRPDLERLTERHPLTVEIPDDLPTVVIDAPRIGQVLVNLVDNACKYSPVNAPIHLCAEPYDGMVRVDVRDHGPGIPPDERESVFEAFQRLDERSNERGAGLGLSIARGIIEGHGGRIWVADTPPPGATFSFTLPIAGGSGNGR